MHEGNWSVGVGLKVVANFSRYHKYTLSTELRNRSQSRTEYAAARWTGNGPARLLVGHG